MKYYILVIAPCDQTFVGPFTAKSTAMFESQSIESRGHDAYVMTETEMRDNMAQYGVIDIQTP